HITAPHPEGKGAYRAMEMALNRGGVSPEEVGYVNAHGTSTPLGDEIELASMGRLFGNNVSISSTKSSIGHLLGAAGGIEAIFTIKALSEGILPPTINLENPSESCRDFDLVPLVAKEKKLQYALSNSFGFGGTNASLLLKAFK
ncbi:MAG TPA: beta-ketoacyl-ACP synthase, partial [Holosporales bacterium]|nr:beta-ketoacyl-ACP synthase [Holosporales bacterium]